MTEPPPLIRNPLARCRVRRGLLALILLVATTLRLHGVAFGLPALNDPDEPLFVMTALEMLRNHSLDPGWFGHPGTITLYGLALTSLAVALAGLASGRFADAHAFVGAAYADPGLIFLPGRLLILLSGVVCVLLTYRLGKRIGGARLGLLAAAFLTVNAVHIEYSQIIRTDVQATVFMLLATLAAIAIFRGGRWRDYLLAGLFVGLGCATKWPAAVIALSPMAAGLYRILWGRAEGRRLAAFCLAALGSLLLVSPYLLLDHQTVLRDLAGEARRVHPGATGGGFLANLGWYVDRPLLSSLGVAGLALTLLGLGWGTVRSRLLAVAVLPGFLAFLVIICAQALRWERWIVPLLPLFALALAYALCRLADLLRARLGRRLPFAEPLAALLLMIPMAHAVWVNAAERAHDTRQIASAWVRGHVPPGRSILIEHAAFDILQGPWRFLFPLGSAGCIDVHAALAGHIRYSRVEGLRADSPIMDLGHVDMALLDSCRADYAVLTHYARYRADAATFGDALGRYRTLLKGARIVAVIRPEPGRSAGPVVHIVRLSRTRP